MLFKPALTTTRILLSFSVRLPAANSWLKIRFSGIVVENCLSVIRNFRFDSSAFFCASSISVFTRFGTLVLPSGIPKWENPIPLPLITPVNSSTKYTPIPHSSVPTNPFIHSGMLPCFFSSVLTKCAFVFSVPINSCINASAVFVR